jgi:F-type H+-transporting ATPase subunit b
VEDIGKWQMLLTHAVGFVIAVWILKRYAWKPILNILEERRQKIQADFDEAAEDRRKSGEIPRPAKKSRKLSGKASRSPLKSRIPHVMKRGI